MVKRGKLIDNLELEIVVQGLLKEES